MPAKTARLAFEFPEDRHFFRRRICKSGQRLGQFADLFDFRSPLLKRREFNKLRPTLLAAKLREHGASCQLRIDPVCDPTAKITLDHVIPLSTNVLNKELRGMKGRLGKKVPAQSFGSNDPKNLVLACERCNGHKKHLFLEATTLRRVLREASRRAR